MRPHFACDAGVLHFILARTMARVAAPAARATASSAARFAPTAVRHQAPAVKPRVKWREQVAIRVVHYPLSSPIAPPCLMCCFNRSQAPATHSRNIIHLPFCRASLPCSACWYQLSRAFSADPPDAAGVTARLLKVWGDAKVRLDASARCLADAASACPHWNPPHTHTDSPNRLPPQPPRKCDVPGCVWWVANS